MQEVYRALSHDCRGLDSHQRCINSIYVWSEAAIKLFDLLLMPEGNTKDVPFKRKKVIGRRKDIGEARGKQDRGCLLQIYNAKREIRPTSGFPWLSIAGRSQRE